MSDGLCSNGASLQQRLLAKVMTHHPSSIREVSMTLVIGSGGEFESVSPGVAASYRLRTRREHKAAAMQLEGVEKMPLSEI